MGVLALGCSLGSKHGVFSYFGALQLCLAKIPAICNSSFECKSHFCNQNLVILVVLSLSLSFNFSLSLSHLFCFLFSFFRFSPFLSLCLCFFSFLSILILSLSLSLSICFADCVWSSTDTHNLRWMMTFPPDTLIVSTDLAASAAFRKSQATPNSRKIGS